MSRRWIPVTSCERYGSQKQKAGCVQSQHMAPHGQASLFEEHAVWPA
jgi:hypothetical protein